MDKLSIETNELYERVLHYFSCRDINDGTGGRTIPIKNNIEYMARELTREICKSDEDYYDSDDFRSRA